MKKKMIYTLMLMCLLCGGVFLAAPIRANAEATDIYQVNGKYKITSKKLVTYCKLYTADKEFPKKTRTYKITSKTKFQRVNEDFSKTTVKKSKVKKLIKKLNKSQMTIQFKEKNGKVTYLWYDII